MFCRKLYVMRVAPAATGALHRGPLATNPLTAPINYESFEHYHHHSQVQLANRMAVLCRQNEKTEL